MTDAWWQNDPVVAATPAATSGGDWWKKDPVVGGAPQPTAPQQQQPLSWSDVGKQALQNAPASGARFAEDIAQPFIHPIDTAKSLKNLGEGVLEKSGLMSGHDEEKFADAFGGYFKNRYGSVQGFKHAVASDPVGVLGDLSTVLTLGGGAAARAPGLIGKAGEIVADIGDSVNPVMTATKAAGRVAGRFGKAADAAASAVPSTEDLYTAADEAYSHPAIKELAIKPKAVREWRDLVRARLENDEAFDPDLAEATFKVLKGVDRTAAKGTITGNDLNNLRKKFRLAANHSDNDRAASPLAIKHLDDFVEQIPSDMVLRGDPKKVADVLANARGNYAAGKRSQLVGEAIEQARRNAESSHSGMNIDNATRQKLKAILNNPKMRRGFSEDETDAMEQVLKGTYTGNALRFAGNLLGGGGGLGASASAAIGAASAGPIGAMAPIVGFALKSLENRITQRGVDRLQALIRTRSPLGKQIESPLRKYGEASVIYRSAPVPINLARLLNASRNLSHNLADAGFHVAPDDLVDSESSQNNQAATAQ